MSSIKIDYGVKIGGSAITDKRGVEKLLEDELQTAGDTIARYDVKRGIDPSSSAETDRGRYGMAVTRLSVTRLNHMVVDVLVQRHLPAVGVSPLSLCEEDGQRLDMAHVAALIDRGFIPVLHGDCVLQATRGWTILSGDTVISQLVRHFPVDLVAFLTDVAGVFDMDPACGGANLIPLITVDKHTGNIVNVASPIDTTTQSDHADVTGGMKLKLSTAVDILQGSPNTTVLVCRNGAELSTMSHKFDETGEHPNFSGTVIKII